MGKRNRSKKQAVTPVGASDPGTTIYNTNQGAHMAQVTQVQQVPLSGGPSIAQPEYLTFDNYRPIPDTFTRVGCCAFQCCYCEDNCFGVKLLSKCLCFEFEYYYCKGISNNPIACLLLDLQSVELVECVNNCKCLFQACCCEAIAGCPLEESYVQSPQVDYSHYGRVDENYVYPFNASCCMCCGSIQSLYVQLPQCASISTDSSQCCCYSSKVCLKPSCGDPGNVKPNSYMILCRNRSMLIQSNTLCKDHYQIFCFDYRCACPNNEEVPCLLMLPCTYLICCVNYRFSAFCCASLAELQAFAQSSVAQSARNKQTI